MRIRTRYFEEYVSIIIKVMKVRKVNLFLGAIINHRAMKTYGEVEV
jgi:hypothetical protein